MAMGGSYNKGNGHGHGSNGGNGNSHRGRSYGLMLVLAFGAALLGVMVLHKLRERRIFNLLLKEKDTDLISLQLLLQKEGDYSKEVKKKNGEMKTKLYTIRTQNMELDRRTLELKSTIDSLKDELQTMEAALEEKQNEIKMLRLNSENENPQVVALLESLKQKEAEIEDLKYRLDEHPVKVWSVSRDDPSNPPANLTLSESVAGKEKTEVKLEMESTEESNTNKDIEKTRPGEGGIGNKPMNLGQGEMATEAEDQIGNREGETERREVMVKQAEKLDLKNEGQGKTTEEGQGKKNEYLKDGDLANAAESINGSTNGKDLEHKASDGEEINKIRELGHLGSIENSEQGGGEKLPVTPKGGMKLEMQDNSDNSESSRVRGKQDFIGSNKRRKWRLIARNRRLENRRNYKNNGVGSMRVRRFFNDDRNEFKGREEEAASNRRLTGDDHPMEAWQAVDSSDAIYLEPQNPENTGDLENKVARHTSDDDRKQKLEVGKSEDHEAIDIQQNLKSRDTNRPENSTEHTHDLPRDLEVADAEESEKDATDGRFDGESGSTLEEDKEEYKEEMDESEF